MAKNYYVLGSILLILGLVSAAITYFRAYAMSSPKDLTERGLTAIQLGNLWFFGLAVPLVTGWIAYKVWLNMQTKYGAQAQIKYLLLAIIIGVVLSVLAAITFKMRGFVEFLFLHVIYIIGLGWIMPMLLLK